MSDFKMNLEKLNNACKKVSEAWDKMIKENNTFDEIRMIEKDILDRKDIYTAYEIFERLNSLLIACGVTVKTKKYNLDEKVKLKESDSADQFNKELVIHYGISIDGLDFTEHDKVFEDKIVELENIINHKLGDWDEHGIPYKEILDMKSENKVLKQRIAEFENKETVELPFDALETANMLINAKYKDEIPLLGRQIDKNVYDIDDLEQIAEHLLVYCKHNREDEE